MNRELAAVLWDLDGTLIDSEPYWMRAEIELAEAHGGEWTPGDAAACIGNTILVTSQRMIARGVRLSTDEISARLFARMHELIHTEGLPYRPGALELIHEITAAGVPQALVTMSYGAYVEAALGAFPPNAFEKVRTGTSVARGKPAPDIYLAAAADLALAPQDCLAVEDSHAGAQAILSAGVTPVVVAGHGSVPEHPDLIRLTTLAGVTFDHFRELHFSYAAARA